MALPAATITYKHQVVSHVFRKKPQVHRWVMKAGGRKINGPGEPYDSKRHTLRMALRSTGFTVTEQTAGILRTAGGPGDVATPVEVPGTNGYYDITVSGWDTDDWRWALDSLMS